VPSALLLGQPVAKVPHKVLPSFRMKQIVWDVDKSALLHTDRGVCFEDGLLALEQGALLDRLDTRTRKYPGQRIMVVAIGRYAYLVRMLKRTTICF